MSVSERFGAGHALRGDLLESMRLAIHAGEVLSPADRPEFVRVQGRDLARSMLRQGLTSAADLRAALLELQGMVADAPPVRRELVDALLVSLVTEHTMLVQRMVLHQQEAIHQASLAAHAEVEAQRRASEARFSALFADAPVGIGIGDVTGRILQVNEALQRMFGYTSEEMKALGVQSFMHADDAPQVWDFYEQLITGQRETFRTEKRYLHKDGTVIWTDLSVSLIRDENGMPTHQIAVIQDISSRHALEYQLRYAATHDALTGLPNRALFMQHLAEATRTAPPGAHLTLCFLDVDDFKMLNDVRGHLVGDSALREIARRLREAMEGTGALVARLGGDEFVVLSDVNTPSAEAGGVTEDLGRRLMEAMQHPLQLPGSRPTEIRASVGTVELPAVQATAENLLQAADLALRAAKEEGKGRVVRHEPTRTARQLSRVRIALSLPGVVDRNELTVVYQPMIRLDDNTLHGMEALVRWNHPELGELMPDSFIPIAEESGDIAAIGDWVIERACRDLMIADWPAVNINMSSRQLYRPTLIDDVAGWLAAKNVEPQRLRIELTETVIVNTADPVPLRAMQELADLGVKLVMDDFGTGYSNMAALRRMPLHELKIAATFLQDSHPQPHPLDKRMLSAVVDLAHDFGLVVTVEGVESAQQHELVVEAGCDVGQGWYYGVAVS